MIEHDMTDWNKAKEQLFSDDTLGAVACSGSSMLTGAGRGVKPLLSWLAQGISLQGYSAADRVVGKAAALLYTKLGVCAVYAQTMSEGGLATLRAHGIESAYGELVPMILNRTKSGMCPIESSVLNVSDVDEAEQAIRTAVAKLMAARSAQ